MKQRRLNHFWICWSSKGGRRERRPTWSRGAIFEEERSAVARWYMLQSVENHGGSFRNAKLGPLENQTASFELTCLIFIFIKLLSFVLEPELSCLPCRKKTHAYCGLSLCREGPLNTELTWTKLKKYCWCHKRNNHHHNKKLIFSTSFQRWVT